jgi:hypothetical protein
VVFRISDAFLPDSTVLKLAFADATELEGTVVGFSDSGNARRFFALIEVTQKKTVVVPVENLRPLGAAQNDRPQQHEEK